MTISGHRNTALWEMTKAKVKPREKVAETMAK